MISKLSWRLNKWRRSIWAPVIGFAVLGNLTAVFAQFLGPLVPLEVSARIGAEAVDQLLNILATSMLGVTTFAVSIMVTAFASAATNATPRSLALLQSDRHTRYVLAIFIGAFIYSLVGIIGINAGLYSEGGRTILFIVTVAALVLIVLALMRWIAHLTVFGRMADTLDRAEAATRDALDVYMKKPFLGAIPVSGKPPENAEPIASDSVGYVEHVDVEHLSDLAEKHDLTIHVAAGPGTFVHGASALAHVERGMQPAELATVLEKMRSAWTIGNMRSFDQDPRFGISTLTEIASRALSPGVNDPGTAIDVLGRITRVLGRFRYADIGPDFDPRFPKVRMPPLMVSDLMIEGFGPIAEYGSGSVVILTHVLDMLAALSQTSPETFAVPAAAMARRTVDLGEASLLLDTDKQAIRARAATIEAEAKRISAS